MTTRRRRKCRHCGQLFRPDPRNLRHQRYCSAKECRRASKAASQGRWLAKAENRDYFRGPEQVARVRTWRAAHPGYGRKKPPRRPACKRSVLAWSRPFVEVVVPGRGPATGTYRQRICLQFLCRGLSQTLFTGTDDWRCTSSLPRP